MRNRASLGLLWGALTGLPLLISIFAPKGIALLFTVSAVIAAALHLWPSRLKPRFPLAPGRLLALLCLWALISALWAFDPKADAIGALRLAAMMAAGLCLCSLSLHLDEVASQAFEKAFLAASLTGLLLIAFDLLTDSGLMTFYFEFRDGEKVPEGFRFFLYTKRRAMIAALALWPAMLAARSLFGPKAALALAALTVLVLAFHESTTALGAALIGSAVFALAWKLPRLTFAGGCLALALHFASPPFLKDRIPTPDGFGQALPNLSCSAMHRILIWDFALARIAERPVLGFGFDAAREFGGREPKRQHDFEPTPGRPFCKPYFEPIPLHTHNGVIQLWLELGGVGAALGLAVLLAVWRLILAGSDPWRRGAQSAFFAGTMVPVLLSYGLFQAWWVGCLWILIAAFQAGRRA